MIFGWSWDIYFLALLVIWGVIYARGKKHGIVMWGVMTFFTALGVFIATRIALFIATAALSLLLNVVTIIIAVVISLVLVALYRRRKKSGGI